MYKIWRNFLAVLFVGSILEKFKNHQYLYESLAVVDITFSPFKVSIFPWPASDIADIIWASGDVIYWQYLASVLEVLSSLRKIKKFSFWRNFLFGSLHNIKACPICVELGGKAHVVAQIVNNYFYIFLAKENCLRDYILL